ncbi:hypothetical protein BH24ACT4_BH24ACT4_07230 [soil metagenome]
MIALLVVVTACGGGDDSASAEVESTAGPSPTSAEDGPSTEPGAPEATGSTSGPAGDEEARDFEVRITDVFEPEGETMQLVGIIDDGTLRPTDAFETTGPGTSTFGVVLRIDRVTPQPPGDDVEEAEAPSGINLVVTVDDPDVVMQGQVMVRRV